METNKDTPLGYINKAIESMNKEANKEVITEIAPIEEKKRGRPKVITEKKQKEILKVAEEVFFLQAIAGKVGIYRERITDFVRENKDFASSLTYARDKWIQAKINQLQEYAADKKTKDWRAIEYLLTIAERDLSRNKWNNEAMTNQDAKIQMIIHAEKLTIAQSQATKLIGASKPEGMSLIPKPKKLKQ